MPLSRAQSAKANLWATVPSPRKIDRRHGSIFFIASRSTPVRVHPMGESASQFAVSSRLSAPTGRGRHRWADAHERVPGPRPRPGWCITATVPRCPNGMRPIHKTNWNSRKGFFMVTLNFMNRLVTFIIFGGTLYGSGSTSFPGSFISRPGDREMKEPGNEVGAPSGLRAYAGVFPAWLTGNVGQQSYTLDSSLFLNSCFKIILMNKWTLKFFMLVG